MIFLHMGHVKGFGVNHKSKRRREERGGEGEEKELLPVPFVLLTFQPQIYHRDAL